MQIEGLIVAGGHIAAKTHTVSRAKRFELFNRGVVDLIVEVIVLLVIVWISVVSYPWTRKSTCNACSVLYNKFCISAFFDFLGFFRFSLLD